MGPDAKQVVRNHGRLRRARSKRRSCKPGLEGLELKPYTHDDELEAVYLQRALRLQEVTKYTADEDTDSGDEPETFISTFKPATFWTRLLDD